jgi:hypothetical protein
MVWAERLSTTDKTGDDWMMAIPIVLKQDIQEKQILYLRIHGDIRQNHLPRLSDMVAKAA